METVNYGDHVNVQFEINNQIYHKIILIKENLDEYNNEFDKYICSAIIGKSIGSVIISELSDQVIKIQIIEKIMDLKR